jgi:hypothetical protein
MYAKTLFDSTHQSILSTLSNMSAPTRIMAGPVAYGGMEAKMGDRNIEMPNPNAITKEVMPVLPPSRMPTADSVI